MDCARNIITANFSGGGTSATTAPLWQWDYGQVLCITGIEDLPAAFEVHFSTNRTGGVSTVAVGADGQVTIPNVLLTIGKNLNAWIYLSDAQGEGETEYSITIPVKARPMPETYDAEVTGEFDDVVRQVSEYAQTAQTAADNAGASASAAAASADNAAASASAADAAKTAAETAQGKAEDAQAAAETAAQTATDKASQTAQDAAQAAQSKTDAESAAQRAEAAQAGAESAKTDAETAAQSAADSASAASASATSAGQSATSAGQSATAAAGSATTAGNAAQTATTKAGEAFASADAAAASETAAQTAQTAAETAATNAGQSASTATTKAAEAAQSASNAAASETAAEAAATRAETAAATLTVDDALSDTSENPVQNKVITGEVTQLKNAIDDMTDTTDKSGGFVSGNYIYTNVSVGTTVDVTPVENSGFRYQIIPCYKGDKFVVTVKGGTNPKAWAFTDGAYKLLSKASAITVTDTLLNAESDGYLILNTTTNSTPSVTLYRLSTYNLKSQEEDHEERISALESDVETIESRIDNVTKITDPHLLFWRMGAFDANGPQSFANGMLSKNRFFTVVKVKAGSTVRKKSGVSHARNISFGYKLTENDASLSGFQSNAGDSLIIGQDCIAYIGIRYSSPIEDLLDDTVLDTFDFDLTVIDYLSRYFRGEGVKNIFAPASGTYRYAFPRSYGYPCPDIYYEGQHTDTTGWTNSFSDIDAVHTAFDALATASDGYLSRTADYGVVYTGNADNPLYEATDEWHMYEYTTSPGMPTSRSVPKVAITCCMHGNEKMSAYAMHYLMYDLIYNATKNPVLSWLKSNCIITFIPICNPYGFMKATPSRLNENGVNLNRNFPTYNWSEWEDPREYPDINGSYYGGLNYKGASAASETETKAMMQFYRNNYDAVLAIDLHTNGADTVARDQISAYMISLPQDTSDKNYDVLNSFFVPGYTFNSRLKPWLNEKYDAGIPYNLQYGSVIEMSYYPCAPHWVIETAGLVGQCYEVMAGSSNGFIGEQLTVYGPATIKAAAEEIGNLLVTLLAHCKDLR